MNDRHVFFNFLLFCSFLLVILLVVFFSGVVDIVNLFVLFLLSSLGYFFFYKGSFFQKFLFALSIFSLLAFITLDNVWFFESYSPYMIVLNWVFIWLISKKSSNSSKIIAKNRIFSIGFVLYLVFNFILILPRYDIFVIFIIMDRLLENVFFILLALSLILSIFYVISTLVEDIDKINYRKILEDIFYLN